jgi:transposase
MLSLQIIEEVAMSQERLSMRKIGEVLRLKWSCDLSNRAVARSCRISHSTVSDYLTRAEKAGLKWPLPETLTEDELYQLLFPEKNQDEKASSKPLPDWEKVRKELKKRNVTLRLIWVEYKEDHPDGYQYSQFCDLYRQYIQKLDPPMRQNHKGGEKLFVDYAGDTIPITDPKTGEVWQAQIFVAVQGASSYTYAEAQASQELFHWIGGHVRAILFFGGCNQIIVPDNLKQGVKSPCWYDPDLNQTYLEMAQHYGVAILPARVKKPRDKAKAEVGVQVVERWILARLRNRTFFSLAECNRVIRGLLDEINKRPMAHLQKSRLELFAELDRPALQPIPAEPYEYATYKTARVNIDYHVDFEKHFYSVPYAFIHEEVRIRATERLVEIFHKSKRDPIATHPRSHTPGRYSTQTDHLPPKHQKAGEWNPERLKRWAEEIGPKTADLVGAILSSRQHPEQAFRSCLGILRLSGQFTQTQMEMACQIARETQTLNYRGVKEVLDTLPPLPVPDATPLPSHENIRGNAYYQ